MKSRQEILNQKGGKAELCTDARQCNTHGNVIRLRVYLNLDDGFVTGFSICTECIKELTEELQK